MVERVTDEGGREGGLRMMTSQATRQRFDPAVEPAVKGFVEVVDGRIAEAKT
jgi:hypothetical protein